MCLGECWLAWWSECLLGLGGAQPLVGSLMCKPKGFLFHFSQSPILQLGSSHFLNTSPPSHPSDTFIYGGRPIHIQNGKDFLGWYFKQEH